MKIMRVSLTICVLCLLSITSARADELLDQGLERMAVEIKKFLQEERLPTSMIVGDFSGSPRLKSSGGVEISRSIARALEAQGISIKDDADLQLMGKFKLKEKRQFPEDDFTSLALEIEATILDGDDEELVDLPISVFGNVALQIAGKDIDVSPKANPRERQESLKHQVKKPPTKTKGSRTKASETSPFSVEILVVDGNRLTPRTPTQDGLGRSFVALHRNEEYMVRIHNEAPFEAAVTLSIDGVDMFVDAKDAPKNSRIIVMPGKSASVPGWYITKTTTKAFEISGYEDSVAKRQGSRAKVGTITATVRACWDPDGERPDDEPRVTPKGGVATKQGRDITKNYKQVIRDFGAVRAVINVRYDR